MPGSLSRGRAKASKSEASERTSPGGRHSLLRRLAPVSVASLAGGLLVPIAFVVAAPAASASPLPCGTNIVTNPCSVTFDYTGGTQQWTIPAGTVVMTVTSDGAGGGAGSDGTLNTGGGGAPGEEVTSTVDVSAGLVGIVQGSILEIFVGGQGGNSQLGMFAGGSGGGESCVNNIFPCGGSGGSGGGGSGVGDIDSLQWINIAAGGGGGGGGGDSAGDNGGAASVGVVGFGSDCTPPDILSTSGGAGAGGDNADGGGGSGGGAGGGCPGGTVNPNGDGAGLSGSDTNPGNPGHGNGGSEGQSYTGPATSGLASFGIGSGGNGVVTIDYAFYDFAPGTLTTTPSSSSAAVGTTMKDTATLSGLSDLPGPANPGGSIAFSLFDGSTLVHTEAAPVTGNGSYTTPTGYVPSATGDYHWDAVYSGDGYNPEVMDVNDSSEDVTVKAAQPTISVAPAHTSIQLGDSATTLTATATLSGGYNPSGTITFYLYNLCSFCGNGDVIDTEGPVTVSGNGPYSTPTGYTLPTTGTVTGTYGWIADYTPAAGDTNNLAAASNPSLGIVPASSQESVTAASPTLTTAPSPSPPQNSTTVSYAPGTTLTDTATVSGGYNPTGAITFTLYYTPPCTGFDCLSLTEAVDTEGPIAVNGNGNYTTPTGFTLPTSGNATGVYQWDATYNGDGNNNPDSDINDLTEQTTINPATAQTTTTLNTSVPAVTYGSESAETFSGTVSGPAGDGTPQGSVQITTGTTTLCAATLNDGSFSCSPADFALPTGNYTDVTATYVPAAEPNSSNPNYNYSGSDATVGLMVYQAEIPTSTALTLGAPTVSYGSEGAETFTGTVAGVTGYGTPQGAVQIFSGSTVLCDAPLGQGPGDTANFECALSSTQLDADSYPVQTVYEPSPNSSSNPSVTYLLSESTPASFTVTPEVESSTTTLTVSAPSVTYGTENAETLTGTVSGQAGDGVPQGTVQIMANSLTVCPAAPLTTTGPDSATYSCTLGATQLPAGDYGSVTATYMPATASSSNPDYSYTGSLGTGSFTVNKATPVISWSNPANIVFGTLLSPTQLDAAASAPWSTASLPGSYVYSPAQGTLLAPGNSQALQVTFTPTDGTDFTTAAATVHINVTSLACLSSSSGGGLTVGSGQAGCVTGGTQSGMVTVSSKGAFYMNGGTIKGNLVVNGATAVWLCNVTITGGITITGSSGPVLVGGTGCANLIESAVSITGNTGGVTYLGNTVKGSLTITGNSGPFVYVAAQNSATGKVTVSGNT